MWSIAHLGLTDDLGKHLHDTHISSNIQVSVKIRHSIQHRRRSDNPVKCGKEGAPCRMILCSWVLDLLPFVANATHKQTLEGHAG